MKHAIGLHAGVAGLLFLAFGPALRPAPMPTCEPTPISSLPFTITHSGIYCLTDNLTGVVGMEGIDVQALNVTIDLNGFTLQGVAGSLTGIECENIADLHVKNGVIRDWDGFGIQAGGQAVVSDVSVYQNALGGVCAETNVLIERCSFVANGEAEIDLGRGGHVRDSWLRTNSTTSTMIRIAENGLVESTRVERGDTGISMGVRSSVKGCTVTGFEGTGVRLGDYGVIETTHAGNPSGAATTGLGLSAYAKVSDCTVEGTFVGIGVALGGSLRSCSVDGASRGILAGDRSRILECVVDRALLLGIDVAEQCNIAATTVVGGLADGIRVGANSVVEHCLVSGNAGFGIQLADECVARGNTAAQNGGSGLVVDGNRCRVEHNTLDSNQTGLMVDGTHTLSTENRAVNNAGSDFDVDRGNPTGPLISTSWWIQGSNPQANFRTPLF